MKGCDYAWDHPTPSAIVAAGCGFVMRYLSNDDTKNLTATERDALWAAGLKIGLVWEAGAENALGGYAQGVTDAQKANAEALDLGLGSAPIFFAVDFDITDTQKPTLALYLEGAASVIGAARVGVYGDYYAVDYCVNNNVPVAWFWQTEAWSGGLIHTSAHILQSANGATIGGVSVDLDTSMKADFGVTAKPTSTGGTSMTNQQYLAGYQEWRDWRLLDGADPTKRPTDIPSTIPSDWWTALQKDIAFQNSVVTNATNQLQAEVSTLQQELSDTQSQLTTAQQSLTAAQADLAAAQTRETNAKSFLTQAESALTS